MSEKELRKILLTAMIARSTCDRRCDGCAVRNACSVLLAFVAGTVTA